MRPCGPDPFTLSSRKPRSRAMRRAAGVARGRSPTAAHAYATSFVSPAANGETSVADADSARAFGGGGRKLSPSARIQPMQAPTGSTSPSDAATNFNTPDAGASTSIAALSVSISNSVEPFLTCAPSAACQRPIRPEVISISTRGITISTAMSDLVLPQTPRSRDDVLDLRNRRLLQNGAIGDRRLDTAEPQDRRVKIIEGFALRDDGRDLRADAQSLDALVNVLRARSVIDFGAANIKARGIWM